MKTCPRCRSTYFGAEIVCSDCQGKPLAPSELKAINAGTTIEQGRFAARARNRVQAATPQGEGAARAIAAEQRDAPLPAELGASTSPLNSAPAHSSSRNAEPPQGDLIGETLGSYRVVRLLGEGGMGAVYLGEHPRIGAKVAIKVLHPRYAADPAIVERFFNEARSVNLIAHENIVKILDFNVSRDGRHYYVMEFLEGASLNSLTDVGTPCPIEFAGPILLQCCAALQATHDQGIVHRDLKPDNIFLVRQMGRANVVKLVDFGIAKLSDSVSMVKTETGTVMGTPAYMSPEQASGDSKSIGPRSDVYSLGVVMFQLATGQLPFGGNGMSLRQVIIAHLMDPPPRPRSLNPAIPKRWEEIILRTLAKEPGDRFQSMGELHRAIEACLHELRVSLELPRSADILPPVPMNIARGAKSSSPKVTRPGAGSKNVPPSGVTSIPRTSMSFRTSGSTGSRTGRWKMYAIGAAIAAVAVAALLTFVLRPEPEPEPVPAVRFQPNAGPPVIPALPPGGSPPAAVAPHPATVLPSPVVAQADASTPRPSIKSAQSSDGPPANNGPDLVPVPVKSHAAVAKSDANERAARLIDEGEKLAAAHDRKGAVDKLERGLHLAQSDLVRARALKTLADLQQAAGKNRAALAYYKQYLPLCLGSERDRVQANISELESETDLSGNQ